jgi:hypothetical protein
MRNELSLLKNVWPVVFLGAALMSGCGSADAVPVGPSSTGVPGAVERALEENKADLVVTALEAPPHVRPGEDIPVRLTVCNQGTSRANASAGIYLSSDASISLDDTFLRQTMFVELEGGNCTTWEGSVWNPASQGQHFLGAVADPFSAQEEADEGNNTSSGRPLGVGDGPDFIVSAVTAPLSTRSDMPFTSSVTVCNQGTQRGSGFFRLYLSRDPELSPWEEVYGSAMSVGDLEPGQCFTGDVQVTAQDGMNSAWYAGARVESWGWSAELLESNNTRLSAPIGVGSLPDFTVSGLMVPRSVNPLELFTTTVTVCNQGTEEGDTDVELSLVSGPDAQNVRLLDGFYLGQLQAGACVSRDVTVGLRSDEQGPFHLSARTDRDGQRLELLEDNNTRASESLNISWP